MTIVRRARLAARLLRTFSTTRSKLADNRIYDAIRSPEQLHTYLLLSSSSRTPLITLWTASWSGDCATVSPIIQDLIESHSALANKGIGFAEVELDSPDLEDLTSRFLVKDVPLLLAFDRQEPQMDTKVTDVGKLKDQKFLIEWLDKEVQRGGSGGAGGSLFGGLYGRLKL